MIGDPGPAPPAAEKLEVAPLAGAFSASGDEMISSREGTGRLQLRASESKRLMVSGPPYPSPFFPEVSRA